MYVQVSVLASSQDFAADQEGKEGKKRRDNVKESRGEGRERGCVHVLLESMHIHKAGTVACACTVRFNNGLINVQ